MPEFGDDYAPGASATAQDVALLEGDSQFGGGGSELVTYGGGAELSGGGEAHRPESISQMCLDVADQYERQACFDNPDQPDCVTMAATLSENCAPPAGQTGQACGDPQLPPPGCAADVAPVLSCRSACDSRCEAAMDKAREVLRLGGCPAVVRSQKKRSCTKKKRKTCKKKRKTCSKKRTSRKKACSCR